MITVAVIVAAWIVLSVPLSLGLGWLIQHGRPAEGSVAHRRGGRRRVAEVQRVLQWSTGTRRAQ